MSELGPTGSLRPGYSMAVLIEKMARPDDLNVTDPIRQAWQAAAGLFQHIDNREDNDVTGAVPEDAESSVDMREWNEYTGYLAKSSNAFDLSKTVPEFPQENQLTAVQVEAFCKMFGALVELGDADMPDLFAMDISLWIAASRHTKEAQQLFWPDGYMQARAAEARYLARPFIRLVPKHDRRNRFGHFANSVFHVARAAKAWDSVVDLQRDYEKKNTQLGPGRLLVAQAISLATTAREALVIGAHQPRMIGKLVTKAALATKNRRGDYNADRIHE